MLWEFVQLMGSRIQLQVWAHSVALGMMLVVIIKCCVKHLNVLRASESYMNQSGFQSSIFVGNSSMNLHCCFPSRVRATDGLFLGYSSKDDYILNIQYIIIFGRIAQKKTISCPDPGWETTVEIHRGISHEYATLKATLIHITFRGSEYIQMFHTTFYYDYQHHSKCNRMSPNLQLDPRSH